jgi:hypothetical protein
MDFEKEAQEIVYENVVNSQVVGEDLAREIGKALRGAYRRGQIAAYEDAAVAAAWDVISSNIIESKAAALKETVKDQK